MRRPDLTQPKSYRNEREKKSFPRPARRSYRITNTFGFSVWNDDDDDDDRKTSKRCRVHELPKKQNKWPCDEGEMEGKKPRKKIALRKFSANIIVMETNTSTSTRAPARELLTRETWKYHFRNVCAAAAWVRRARNRRVDKYDRNE